jgi:hypothetical protein
MANNGYDDGLSKLACRQCTYENKATDGVCQMCGCQLVSAPQILTLPSGRQRVLPLMAQWTLVCHLPNPFSRRHRYSTYTFNKSPYQLVSFIRTVKQLPIYVNADGGSKFISRDDDHYESRLWLTATWFHGQCNARGDDDNDRPTFFSRDSLFRIAAAIVERSDISLLSSPSSRTAAAMIKGGPLFAIFKRRRLPDRSLITLMILGNNEIDDQRDLFASRWKSALLSPTTTTPNTLIFAIVPSTLEGPIDQRISIGILHSFVARSCAPIFQDHIIHHRLLIYSFLPHISFGNVSMYYVDINDKADDIKDLKSRGRLTPWQIAALKGDKDVLTLLEKNGCGVLNEWMHPNEVKLRQLIEQNRPFATRGLHQAQPRYLREDEFEIDHKSAAIIPQGENSKVYQATRIDDEKKSMYAVKMIPISNDTSQLAQVASEIGYLHYLSQPSPLEGFTASDDRVTIITPYLIGGTLDVY